METLASFPEANFPGLLNYLTNPSSTRHSKPICIYGLKDVQIMEWSNYSSGKKYHILDSTKLTN